MGSEPETVRIPSGDLELHGRLRRGVEGAPMVLLLSGLGFHTFEYEPLAAQLAGSGFNALSFDFRGHGRSEGRRGQWVLNDLVADTRGAIEFAAQHERGPIYLFGNSLGAMVAIQTAVGDERVVAVAAANAPAHLRDFLLTGPRRVLFSLAKLVAPVVPLRISVNHFYSYDDLIDAPSWVSAIEADPLVADARRLSVATYSTLLDDWDGTAMVRRLDKPVLLIQGRNDRMQPLRQSELLFEAANDPKRYELLETGHLPHLEDPAGLAKLLCGWFSLSGRRQ